MKCAHADEQFGGGVWVTRRVLLQVLTDYWRDCFRNVKVFVKYFITKTPSIMKTVKQILRAAIDMIVDALTLTVG